MSGLAWLYSGFDKLLLPSHLPPQHQHPDKFCAVCDRRIYWFQKAVRVYSLGNNRAHIKCAADYLRGELIARQIEHARRTIPDNTL